MYHAIATCPPALVTTWRRRGLNREMNATTSSRPVNQHRNGGIAKVASSAVRLDEPGEHVVVAARAAASTCGSGDPVTITQPLSPGGR